MGKRALFMKWLGDIRASYWFLPTVLAIFAVILAHLMQYLDHKGYFLTDAWRTTQVEGARATLALISQSVIGVTGVMFSMTIVAVSFASGNFGPRLIGNFMRDRGNQLSLGILIATFVYSLLILRAVQSPFGPEGGNDAFVPHLSMLVALGLTGISVLTMIYYVHHIPEIINVSNISAKLGARLRHEIECLIEAQQQDVEDESIDDFPKSPATKQIFLADDGFLQTWDRDRLTLLAAEHDLYLEVLHPAGSFVTTFTPILNVWSKNSLSDDLENDIRFCFALGNIPTEQQNLIFIVEQLVEMIARALSPGVNDPYTAVNCMNWLYVGLITAANHQGGFQPHRKSRLAYPSLNYETLLEASVSSGFPYIKSDPMARNHLNTLLNRLASETKNQEILSEVKKLQAGILAKNASE